MAFLDENGLAELWKLVKAEDNKGVKIASSKYVGTGANTGIKLTCGFKPKLVVITQERGDIGLAWDTSTTMFFAVQGMKQYRTYSNTDGSYCFLNFTWLDDGLEWYVTEYGGVYNTFNAEGATYYYVAFG